MYVVVFVRLVGGGPFAHRPWSYDGGWHLQTQRDGPGSPVMSMTDLSVPAIVICHSQPPAWVSRRDSPVALKRLFPLAPCPPSPLDYSDPDTIIVGRSIRLIHMTRVRNPCLLLCVCACRTMFETDRVPIDWLDRLRDLHELWVSTNWSASVFAAAGVPASRIQVLPEGVDTIFWDKERVTDDDIAGTWKLLER